ncbi:BTB/POZ domain-containing protein KCTD21-like [Liolophura sinensis]|uniref:BTB/POZ domain-containing protein KCTD21-like n=1 Tax=Liolophura sinensis TaxID=3198878 RepID=UPI00315871CF
MTVPVTLNVGGVLYTTSRTTLTLFGDSMLGRMFSGDWETAHDSEGRCFIDRDGHLFRHVLNFLRTGKLIIPEDFPELLQLKSEADFYQIEALIEVVEAEIVRRALLRPEPEVPQREQRHYYLDVVEITTISGRRWAHVRKY